MRVVGAVQGGPDEAFPVYAFALEVEDGAEAKVVVVDRPTKRIVCLPVSCGCHRSCIFCASAPRPFIRTFSAGEMEKMAELVVFHPSLPKTGAPVLLSLMGVGDPLDNRDVAAFLRAAGRQFRTALATTVPSLDALYALMTESPTTKVTVSLHAGTYPTRVAILNTWACLSPLELYRALGDSVEYNYVVMKGINDNTTDEVKALNSIVGDGKMRLKLNTLNMWPGIPCREGVFPVRRLHAGIEVERYSTDGTSVFGACGQCGYNQHRKGGNEG